MTGDTAAPNMFWRRKDKMAGGKPSVGFEHQTEDSKLEKALVSAAEWALIAVVGTTMAAYEFYKAVTQEDRSNEELYDYRSMG